MHEHRAEAINAATELLNLRATYEAMILDHAREVSQLREAAAPRKVIGQAIGMIQCEYHLEENAAFEILRRRSSYANIKLRDIAHDILDRANSDGGQLRAVADC